jgi:chemotaxis protein methyltransferase CheR
MSEIMITSILERIESETGIVLKREIDRDRIRRYLNNGGTIPKPSEPLGAALISLVTTNETYFERESHHFDYLIQEILPQFEATHSSAPIRILSAPCSSGEESYTIALRLLSMGKRFYRPIEIVGVDITEDMILKAQEAIYSERSVHALDKEILANYFIHEERGYRLLPLHGISIRFIVGNLFDDRLWGELGDFDVIFSRNMMIYFDSAKNKELLLRFKKHLRGFLILGHADDHNNAKEIFTPLRSQRGAIYTL